MDQNRVENQVDEGTLQIHLTNASTGIPVKGARITISYTGGPQQVLEEVDTDDSGNTEKITLDAPPLEYSMEPGENQPYAEYTIKVQATGYRDITVSAINILSGEDATQEVVMEAQDAPGDPIDTIVIDAHTLYGEYPPKIPESEIKTVEETGEIVLSRVVIPEYVVVHDGGRVTIHSCRNSRAVNERSKANGRCSPVMSATQADVSSTNRRKAAISAIGPCRVSRLRVCRT